jgi:DNA processing protein
LSSRRKKSPARWLQLSGSYDPAYPARNAIEQNPKVFAVPGNGTNKNSWGPNTLIHQGAKLVATGEDVWQELPENVRLALAPARTDESPAEQTASLFRAVTML